MFCCKEFVTTFNAPVDVEDGSDETSTTVLLDRSGASSRGVARLGYDPSVSKNLIGA
jgi:hypothetical protein